MKKNIFFKAIAAAVVLGMSTGCSDFLDESTRGKVFDNVLQTQNGLESALVGAYRGWENCWGYGFTNGWATEMTLGGDDLTCPPGTGNTQEYDRYDVHDTNSSAPTVYQGCYKAIQGANDILEHADNCEGDKTVIAQMVAEAHFIRAASYFWLVRCHGEVPLITASQFDPSAIETNPSPVADIYNLIEEDLNAAISTLGDSRRNGEMGRPNKGTAQALLAEVYLQEAGWPLNKTEDYAKAADMAKTVIENRQKYGFDFEDSYDVLWENKDNGTNNNYNKEDIWVIPTSLDNGNANNAEIGYWAYPGEIGGWDVVFSEYTWFNEFPEGPRKDATFAYTVTSDQGKVWRWQDLKQAHPYYKKLMKNPDESTYYQYNSQVPVRQLRVSQTALTYAEAKARSGEPDDLAYEMLNTIRRRAGLPEYHGLSAADFAEKAYEERGWELAGEKVRWFDIERMGLNKLKEIIAKKDPKDNQPLHEVTEKDLTFPIPNHDVLLNPNLNANR